MFDSEHSSVFISSGITTGKCTPVLGMEYCPKKKTCTADSDANWKDLEQ